MRRDLHTLRDSKPPIRRRVAVPSEDCGGIHGYDPMLKTVADPDHEEHDDPVKWPGDDLASEVFAIDEINDIPDPWRED